MKKLLVLVACLVLSLMLALPAMATVDVYAEITKDKDKTVVEVIDIYKDIDLIIKQDVKVDKSAESEIVKNQVNSENTVTESNLSKTSTIQDDVFMGAIGIVNVNQASGNMINQGNEVSIAVDTTGDTTGFAHSQVSVEQVNDTTTGTKNTVNATNVTKTNTITGNAFSGSLGIISVNQSAGNMNNQNNATSIAASANAVATLSEADLGQVNTGNYVHELGAYKYDTISGKAFSGTTGIVNVNQSSGNMNNQANVVSIAATLPSF